MDEIKSPNSSSGTLAPTGKKPRKLRRAIFILLAFFGVAFLTVFAAYLLNYYRVQKAWEPYIKQAEQFEREYVIYSGKTPQEVYEKFVVYLKAGDIETASKYYSRKEDQIRQSEYLTKLRAENRLEEYIADLPKWQDMHEEEHWDPSAKKFIYEYVREQDEIFYDELIKQNRTIPAGQYEGELEFYYVAPVGVWKIRL